MTKTKTKTTVAITLSVISIGSIAAGLYYYSWRGAGGANFCPSCAPCPKCPVCPVASDDDGDGEEKKDVDLEILSSRERPGGRHPGTVCDHNYGSDFTIRNNGRDSVGSFQVELRGGWGKSRATVDGLGAGQEKTVYLTIEPKMATHSNVYPYAIVDPDGLISETNEDNNKSNYGYCWVSR